MRVHRISAAVLALAIFASVLALAAPASAQETPTPNGSAAPPPGERIDSNTELVSAEYDGQTGEAVITLRSDRLQPVTITDAGGFIEGGEVDQRQITIERGETTTVRMPITEADGFAGVSITTREVLYAVPLETSRPWFQGSPTWETARLVGIGAVLGSLGITGYLARKRLGGGSEEVERVV